jgi:Undecaprenyl-phosphate glucose phosphotransferase
MLKTHARFFRVLFQFTDALTVGLCWLAAYYIRFYLDLPYWTAPTEVADFSVYLNYSLILMFIWFLALEFSGAYKSWRMESFGREFFTILRASLIGFLIFVAFTHFSARDQFSRVTMLLFLALSVLFLNFSRSFVRAAMRMFRRKGFNVRYVLIVGSPKVANLVAKKLSDRKELGLKIVGLVPVGVDHPTNLKILGTLAELSQILEREGINNLIVTLKNEDFPNLDQIISSVSDTNIDIKIIPDVSQYSILGFDVEEFEGMAILNLNQSPVLGWNAVLKRISDIIYAVAALLVFSPVMFTVALIIKFTSRGPIFYSQERMGLDGRSFKMYKFRSMSTDAEAKTGAVWAAQGDDRTTWIGKIIRKTSLDELPQLFNVLKGDMSCVGPRPERPVFVEKFRKEIPGYMLRHKVKAGMTGWAQVNGLRGNTSLEDRIEYDLYYISHWSLWFDLRIMFMTVFKGFVSPHAY